jgi:hypothetical protein
VKEEFPEPLLHPALFAVGTGERLGPAFEIKMMRRVALFDEEVGS